MTFFWTHMNTPGTDDSADWWGSTLSRMTSTLHYFNWLHLVFIFKNSRVFVEGWHFPEPHAVPEHTPPTMSAAITMTEVLLQSWGSRKGPASLQGGLWTHSPVHARHSLYRWAAPPPGSLCHLGSRDPPGPASWLSGTVGVCCHTPNQVFLISAIYEVEFFTRLRTILNLFLLVALLRNSPGIQCLALKPLMYLCLTFQCDMEVGAKGRHWADRNWLSTDRGWSVSVLTGKGLKVQSMGT